MRSFPRILSHNWWVIVFILMSGAFYLQVLHEKNCLIMKMGERVRELGRACLLAEAEKEELLLRIRNRDDPEWMELVLKEKLGVVPEGQIKVVFQ